VSARTVPAVDARQRRRLIDEPPGQRLAQCSDGELLHLETLGDRLNEPGGVRAAGRISLGGWHPNRLQA